ncbi:hypothetical protein [Maribacter sp. 2304DJ31-5]|uniref:hypothetical protein n=1 Tax=Maribacter sp. 2304DJ31-5 TaxID=3386273 RepID=UPI0039BD7D58
MGYSGEPMKVIKANRNLLKKRRTFKELRKTYEGYTGETKLQSKELTVFQQKVIRDKIIARAKKDMIFNLGITLISVIIIFFIFGLLYAKFMV